MKEKQGETHCLGDDREEKLRGKYGRRLKCRGGEGQKRWQRDEGW